MINKTFLKFFAGALALAALGVGVAWGIAYYRKINSPEYQVEQYYKELEALYANDIYGGSTPEETLQLFIDALKKGDIELASRYFVIEEQDDIKKNLLQAQDNGSLPSVISRIENLRLSQKNEESASFTLVDADNVIQYQAHLSRIDNGRWKISDF